MMIFDSYVSLPEGIPFGLGESCVSHWAIVFFFGAVLSQELPGGPGVVNKHKRHDEAQPSSFKYHQT